MSRRAALVVAAIVVLRVVVRMAFAVVTIRHIEVLAIVDCAALLLTAPWVASGAPRATSPLPRAAGVVALLLLTSTIGNLVLFATDNEVGVGMSSAALAGPIGAFVLFVVATGVTWGWLAMHRRAPRSDKLGPAAKERPREDHPHRNVPRPPGSPELRVRKGPHR